MKVSATIEPMPSRDGGGGELKSVAASRTRSPVDVIRRVGQGLYIAAAAVVLAQTAVAEQIAPARTWPELKEATQQRADRQSYPLNGYDKTEVAEILGRITSTDRDEWARSWMINGERHAAKARQLETSSPSQAAEGYLAAWRYYGFGAWPTTNSPEKKKAGELSLEAFRNYARLATPTVEVLRVPTDQGEIVAYLQKPAGKINPPVIIVLGGADAYKEFVAEQYGPYFLKAGFAYVAVDIPAKNEMSELRWEPGAERIYSKLIDALSARTDIDPSRIGFLGASAGGYWANRVAYAEAKRIKALVNWAGPTDHYFDRDWQLKALGTREYLFDLFAVRAGFYGSTTLEKFLEAGPKMSLKSMVGLPSAPMLLVQGEQDSQVPVADTYVVLRSGDPKEAWINPKGGHLGRNAEWPDNRILETVIIPFLSRKLQ